MPGPATSAPDPPDTRPQIWIFGCSFTHGFGVDDKGTYPWMLQEIFPNYQIRNYGISGYGTLHSLLQLEILLKHEEAPAAILLAYGGFHDQRNTSNRYWRKVLSGRQIAEGLRYPHVRFDDNDSLVRGFSNLEYSPFPLMRFSALMHFIELKYNRSEDEALRSMEVTQRLIAKMRSMAEAEGSKFALVGIFRHSDTERMLKHFAEKGVATVDISQDLEQPELRILPSDGHPNAKGHFLMADALAIWLKKFLP